MLNQLLTNKLRQIIQNKGLVNTGRMINQTSVDVRSDSKIIIDVRTTNYFVYLMNEYGILTEFFNSTELQQVIEEIVVEKITDSLQIVIDGGVYKDTFDYQPIFLVNGV